MRTLAIILFLTLIAIPVYADEVSCDIYQSQVSDFTDQVNHATQALEKAQAGLDRCQSVKEIVASDEYQAVKLLKEERHTGNWSDMELIR